MKPLTSEQLVSALSSALDALEGFDAEDFKYYRTAFTQIMDILEEVK